MGGVMMGAVGWEVIVSGGGMTQAHRHTFTHIHTYTDTNTHDPYRQCEDGFGARQGQVEGQHGEGFEEGLPALWGEEAV